MGVGGHDGSRRIGAALPGGGQLGRCGRDAAGKRVDDHRLADDAGRGGQNILSGDVQRLAHQRTALFGQCHTVGGAGVGVAAVDKDGLCIAVLQVGTVHLDGRTADLVGGIDTGGRAADFRFDERQIVFFVVVGPDAAMDTGRCKSSGRTDAARYFLVRHIVLPPIKPLSLACGSPAIPLLAFTRHLPRPGESFLIGEPLAYPASHIRLPRPLRSGEVAMRSIDGEVLL